MREPPVRQISSAPFAVASGLAVCSSSRRSDLLLRRRRRRASCGRKLATLRSAAFAATAMMARHDSVGGRDA
eukprot:4428740-Prymnesium_polylepis.1